jgi:hypothetical protein
MFVGLEFWDKYSYTEIHVIVMFLKTPRNAKQLIIENIFPYVNCSEFTVLEPEIW